MTDQEITDMPTLESPDVALARAAVVTEAVTCDRRRARADDAA